jgi:hypothetical protein
MGRSSAGKRSSPKSRGREFGGQRRARVRAVTAAGLPSFLGRGAARNLAAAGQHLADRRGLDRSCSAVAGGSDGSGSVANVRRLTAFGKSRKLPE